MEKEEKIKFSINVFSFLMRKTVLPAFVFPGGYLSRKSVISAVDALSEDRIVDYCICQVYAIRGFGKAYLPRWNVSHSFGKRAVSRFRQNSLEKYEDKWLLDNGLSRSGLSVKSGWNLQKFVFPEYEEHTKLRKLNTETGFYICRVSTLLWTPFSKACLACCFSKKCKPLTEEKYPELFKIRIKKFKDEQ